MENRRFSEYSVPPGSPRTPPGAPPGSPTSIYGPLPARKGSQSSSVGSSARPQRDPRESMISSGNEYSLDDIETDSSFDITSVYVPTPPPTPPPPTPRAPPPPPPPPPMFTYRQPPPTGHHPSVAPKPDFLHSRNPFAKQGPPDPYVGSGAVVGLNKKTFKKFIRDLDAAFVLFYNPCDKKCCPAKVSMRQAAHVTRKENHAYAAVDCIKEMELCRKQQVFSFPTMKLFVKGMTVNTYDHVGLLPSEIRQYVENAPIVRETVLEKNRCCMQ